MMTNIVAWVMVDWRCIVLPMTFFIGAAIGWHLAQRRARMRQSALKFDGDDWPDGE